MKKFSFDIKLANKKWKFIEDTWYIGDLNFDLSNKILECKVDEIIKILIEEGISHFAIIKIEEETLKIITDPISSFPLISSFNETDHVITITDSISKLDTEEFSIHEVAKTSIYHSGYTLGEDTIFKEVKWISPFSKFSVSNSGETNISNYFVKEKSNEINYSEIEENLIGSLKKVENKKFFLPISAGYDSRYIGFILNKIKGIVSSISYGPQNSWDVKGGKTASELLGFSWENFNASRKAHRDFCKNSLFSEIRKFADLGVSSFYYQDVLPVTMKLSEINNSIVINGNTGDFITGGHLSNKEAHILSDNDICSRLYKKIYTNWKSSLKPNPILLNYISEEIKRIKNKYNCDNALEVIYFFEWENRQAKYVVSGQRVYDFFGLAWKLPFWSIEYIAPHLNVKKEQIIDQKVYVSFLKLQIDSKLFKSHIIPERYQHNNLVRILRKLYKFLYYFNREFFEKWEKSIFLPYLSTLNQMAVYPFFKILKIPPVNKEPAIWSEIYINEKMKFKTMNIE